MDSLWQRNPTRKQLCDFGLMVGIALIVLGTIARWRHPDTVIHTYLWAIGGLLVLGRIVAPNALRLPFQLWMAFAFILGVVATNVILTVTFLVAFGAVGFLMRISRRDPLELAWRPDASQSYWRARETMPVPDRFLRPF